MINPAFTSILQPRAITFLYFTWRDNFKYSEFYKLFDTRMLEYALNCPNSVVGIQTAAIPAKTWSDDSTYNPNFNFQDFVKRTQSLISAYFPKQGQSATIVNMSAMEDYWASYGPLYMNRPIEELILKPEIEKENKEKLNTISVRKFLGTCYTSIVLLSAWYPKNLINGFSFTPIKLVSDILRATEKAALPFTDKYLIYLRLWNDNNQFCPEWKAIPVIAVDNFVSCANGRVYSSCKDTEQDAFLKNYCKKMYAAADVKIKAQYKKLLADSSHVEKYSYEYAQIKNEFREILVNMQEDYAKSMFIKDSASFFSDQATFFPIMLSCSSVEIKHLKRGIESHDYIDTWIKQVFLNSIKLVLQKVSVRIVPQVSSNKINFFPLIDSNIVYFMIGMIEQASAASVCKYKKCGKDLPAATPGKRPRHFCSVSCYDKYRRENDARKRLVDNLRNKINRDKSGKLTQKDFVLLSDEIDCLLEKYTPQEVNRHLSARLIELKATRF